MGVKFVFICIFVLAFESVACSEESALKGQGGKEAVWKREISLGYNKSSGNTEASQLSLSVFLNRKIERLNEFTLKGNAYYSSANEKMDAQKWYGMIRCAFSFGRNKRWYNFYKFETDHDRFANIDYRIVPAAGVGYWFYDLPEIKIMTELGLGFEHTDYRDNTEGSDKAVLMPRGYLEKKIYKDTEISQDIFLYSSLDELSVFRLHSETSLTTLLMQKLSLRISLIDDYNSDPAGDAEKNDFCLISSLIYSF